MYEQLVGELKKLESIREAVCYQMIEADGTSYKKLERRLERLSEEIEMKKMAIEDIEAIRKLSDEYN